MNRYVTNLVLGTSKTTGSGLNTQQLIVLDLNLTTMATLPVDCGVASILPAELVGGGTGNQRLRNLSIKLSGNVQTVVGTTILPVDDRYSLRISAYNGTSHAITLSTVILNNAFAQCKAISPAQDPDGIGTIVEIRYASDRNDGTAQHPAGNVNYWQQTFSSVGPKYTVIAASYNSGLNFDDGGGSPSNPNHTIYIQGNTGRAYTFRPDSDTTSSFNNLFIGASPSAASYVAYEGYLGTPGTGGNSTTDLYNLMTFNSVPNGNELDAVLFPYLHTSSFGVNNDGQNGVVEIDSSSTTPWGVSFRCMKFTHADASRVITTSAPGCSVLADCCQIGDSSIVVGGVNRQRPVWDLSLSGVNKNFTLLRCKLFGTMTTEFACANKVWCWNSQIRITPGLISTCGILANNSETPSATRHIKQFVVEYSDIEIADGNYLACVCILPLNLIYGTKVRVAHNRAKNMARGSCFFSGTANPARMEVHDNNFFQDNMNGTGGCIALGSDASVENPITPFVFRRSRHVKSGTISTTTDYNLTNDAGGDVDNDNTTIGGYDVITFADAVDPGANAYRYLMLEVTGGPGHGHSRSVIQSSWLAGVSTLRLNTRWRGTELGSTGASQITYDTLTDQFGEGQNATAAPPPVGGVSTFSLWKRITGKITVRNNLCVILRLPTNYQNKLQQPYNPVTNGPTDREQHGHAMLVGQGMDHAEISGNICIGGDWGLVLKADSCHVHHNVWFTGHSPFLIKGGNHNVIEYNTFVDAFHNGEGLVGFGGGYSCFDIQDKSNDGSVEGLYLPHIYDSKASNNIITNNIMAVIPDPSAITPLGWKITDFDATGGYDIPTVSFAVGGVNRTVLTVDNNIGHDKWQGDPSVFPMLQSNRINRNLYYHHNPATAASSQIFFLNNVGYTSLVAYRAAWNTFDIQFPDNDSESIFGDPRFDGMDPLLDNADDLRTVFTQTYTAMDADRALAESMFRIAAGSPAARAAEHGAHIGFWQEHVATEMDARTFSGRVVALSNTGDGQAALLPLSGATIEASGTCSIDDETVTFADGHVFATTDSNGNFAFTLDPGDFVGSIRAVHTASGYTSSPLPVTGLVLGQPKTNLNFTSNEQTTQVKFTVIDRDGNLIDGVTITPTVTGGSGCDPLSPITTGSGYNDPGTAVFTVESQCSYSFAFAKSGYVFSGGDIAVADADTAAAQFLAYTSIATIDQVTITGRVLTSAALTFPGVTITFTGTGGRDNLADVITDSNGIYSQTALTNWQGVITPVMSGYSFIPMTRTLPVIGRPFVAGGIILNQDFTQELSNLDSRKFKGKVSALVTHPDGSVTASPLSGVNILATGTHTGGPTVGSAVTNSNGEFSITVNPGDFVGNFSATRAGYLITPALIAVSLVDQVPGDDFSGINFIAEAKAVVLTVNVRNDQGIALPGVLLTPAITDGGSCTAVAPASTDSNGVAVFTIPSDCDYALTLTKDGYVFVPSVIVVDHDLSDPGDFLSASAVGGQNVASSRVSGRILGPCGTPLTGVTVVLTGDGSNPTYEVIPDAEGYWSQIVPAGWTGTVTPVKAGIVFTPTSRHVGS